MANKNVWHVVPYNGPSKGANWAVKREGYDYNSSLHEIKTEAVSEGKEAARKRNGVVIIHRGTGDNPGTVQESISYKK